MDKTAKPAVVVLSPSGLATARSVAGAIGGTVHGLAQRLEPGDADVSFEAVADHLVALFADRRPTVAIMAAGAAMRILAPHLGDKHDEPPVLAVSLDGASVVPLLGGHRGGNALARRIANATGGHAAITTAGDTRLGVALDAPPAGWRLANPQDAKTVMADLVAGASARLEGRASWLEESTIPFDDTAAIALIATDSPRAAAPGSLVYHPATLALGIGAERGADAGEVVALCEAALAENGLARESVALVASLDLKADEAAVHAAAKHFGVPARFFPADRLEAEAGRLATPSEVVFAEVGCHGVAEGAALAAAGSEAALAVPKMKSARATVAIARAPQPIDPAMAGRSRGTLFVVGIGPGSAEWRSPEVTRMIGEATDLVGYSLYLDLLGPLAAGKTRHDFDLGKEEARVRHAMEVAGEGRAVALVCSGDAGIYAMATLVFELLGTPVGPAAVSGAARRIAIAVSPGISALQGAAARAGAPLGHDFCTISLSDLLTPWDAIVRRIQAAAEADFVIAFYNPVSRRRRMQLAHARAVLLDHRPADTPVILATNLGRPGEMVRIVALDALDVDDVDMLTTVVVGSSQSRVIATGDGKTWVYTPRGYAAKAGSAMKAERKKDAAE